MSLLGRFLVWSLALLLALLPVVALLNGWLAPERWPIEQLRITAEYRRVDAEQIRAAVLPHSRRGFFAVDLAAVQQAVAGLDWVAAVEVRKTWPNRLDVTVVEHQPIARWGQQQLLSAQGRLFSVPAQAPLDGLPRFDAPQGRQDEVVRVYQASSALFARHAAQVVGVRLSPRGSWSLRLADGEVIMAGRGEPLPRLQRFAPLLARLRSVDTRRLQRADLRYANGFALRWAEDPPAPPPAAVVHPPSADSTHATQNRHRA